MLKLNEICEKFSKKTENSINHVGLVGQDTQ